MGRIPALDGLRGVAIALVLAMHFSADRIPGGFVGVELFFVLSGFLITGVLLRPSNTLGHFYARRARRLLPALFIALGLAWLGWRGAGFLSAAWPAVSYCTDIVAMYDHQRFGPLLVTWSLSVEEQFYFVWPFVLPLLRRDARLVMALAVVAAVARRILAPNYFSPLCHLDAIFAGCALALTPKVPRARVGALLAVVGLVPVLLIAQHESLAYWTSPAPVLVTLGACALLCEACASGSLVARALSGRPLRWLGERSYGIYLYHMMIHALLAPLHGAVPTALLLVARFALTLLVADVSFRWIEQPILTGVRPVFLAARVSH